MAVRAHAMSCHCSFDMHDSFRPISTSILDLFVLMYRALRTTKCSGRETRRAISSSHSRLSTGSRGRRYIRNGERPLETWKACRDKDPVVDKGPVGLAC
jgi:hypothetical protein